MNLLKFLFSKTFLKQIVLAVFVTIILVIGLFYWLNYYTSQDDYITVPDLTKLEIDIVEKKLNQMNLNYVILDTLAYNPEYPPLSVLEQNPKSGQFVKEKRKIYLTINPADYKKVRLTGNLYGNTLRQVLPSIEALGFQIGDIKEEPDMAKNVVLKLTHNDTLLEEGDMLKKTSVIDIVIGDGSLSFEEQQKLRLEEIKQKKYLDSISGQNTIND
jgi:beta-lactam-binding protein with PASTA domain